MKTFGRSTPRLEDPALLRGQGRFVDDIRLPGSLHAAFVRSPFAHAAIKSIEAAAARAAPGVVAVLTRAELLPYLASDRLVVALPDKSWRQDCHRPVLAADETVHVGEPIAVVIAEDRYLAEDAAALVDIDFDPLPAVSDCREALADGAPTVHRGAPHNLVAAFDTVYGNVEAAFRTAPHVFRDEIWIHRGVAHSLECRGCVAAFDPIDDRLTLWSSTQTPLMALRLLADLLGREESRLRVLAPDVGGGFGPKLVFYPEEAVVAVAALHLQRPVKWIEDRREHFVATTQERDQYWEAEIAVDVEGRILGLRGSLLHDHGAYTARGLTIPQGAVAALTLAYEVPAYAMSVKVALTNKVPATPIRGAGQPQGVFVMERLLDRAARELGLDRDEIRRRNLVPAEKMPYPKGLTTRGGFPVTLDSGDYPACQRDALARAGWGDDFRARQAQARKEGRYIGLGLANYVEATGRGPFEQVSVRIAPSGVIHVASGAAAMGQSTKTMLAQIVAEQLGGDMSRVAVVTGDSAGVTMGFGGFNSRQAVIAGSSAHAAAVKVRDKLILVASHLLEVAPTDLTIDGDMVSVPGSDVKIKMADVARAVSGTAGFALPGGVAPGMEATEQVVIDAMTYANGSAVAEVEVDIATGAVVVRRFVLCHDCGRVINPMIVEGQVVGAVAHGIGNALYEWMGFGADGQPVTTNLADYLLVSATEVPRIEILHRESPTDLNPLGVKGVGESGCIPAPAAIISAVEDALSPFGVTLSHAPVRPSDIVAAIAAGRRL